MNTTPDTVMSLLVSLGFDTETPSDIKIDTFDQWCNSETAVVLGCGLSQVLIAQ